MSSILETFYILFKSDDEDLKKGAQDAIKQVDKVEEQVKKADKSATKLGNNFADMVKKGALWLTTISGVGAAINTAFSVSYVDQLYDSAEAIGVNVESYQSWTNAIQKAGGSATSFDNTITGLREKLYEVSTNGKSKLIPFFNDLGISVYDATGQLRDSLDLLPELAERFEGLSEAKAQGLAMQLGIDAGTMLLLRQGREAVEEQIRAEERLGLVREKDAKAADNFKDSASEFGLRMKVLGSRLMSYLLPPLEFLFDVLSSLAEWAANNGRYLMVFFSLLSVILAVMFAPAVWGAVTALMALIGTALIAAAPFIAIGAAVAALALILEDLWAFFTGAPSVTGEMIKAFQNMIPELKAPFIEFYDWIVGWFDRLGGVVGKVKGFFGFGGNEAIIQAQTQINTAATNPIAAQSSSAIGAKNNTVNKENNISIGEVKVQTQATDADGVARAINDSLKREVNQVANDYDDGVKG